MVAKAQRFTEFDEVAESAYNCGLSRFNWVQKPLWPEPYNQDTFESAWAFVRQNHTWNEAEKEIQPMPTFEYLEAYVWEWTNARKNATMLVTEKCRRMVISWAARALELHQLGMNRNDQLLGGEDFSAAAKHVWRLKHLYVELKKRNPSWNLPDHKELKYEGERQLKMFGLANGSTCNYINGESGQVQGEGVSIITLEEAGMYRNLSNMVAQAKIITQGSANHKGGFVNLITNTSPGFEWQRVKSGGVLDTS